jgi:CRISPR-associated protein Csx14
MVQASIPVDLFNPGQVFACLGFLEATDVILGDAEGGFDWSEEADVRFALRANGGENPFAVVLRLLARAEVRRLAPIGYSDANVQSDGPVHMLETFPGREANPRDLPVRLEVDSQHLDFGHWCDGSSRNDFKLYAGQQRAPGIVREMLRGIGALWKEHGVKLAEEPFRAIAMGGSSFKLDARKAWTGIDAGYSPDEQGHGIAASPVVELLAAVGLEHARPDEYETRQVRYGAWGGLLPPTLARPALAGAPVGIALRMFRFTLDLAGKNKVVTFAQEETAL